MTSTGQENIDLEWEEWDGNSPFLHHCVAGSLAGVAEHTLLYPVDTVKTHMQAYCSTCPNNPANIDIPNVTNKAVCIGPPSTISSPPLNHPNTSTMAPQGMFQTMRNLIQHGHAAGHSTNPFLAHNHAALVSPKGARQTATLSAQSAPVEAVTESIHTSKGISRLWRGVQTMMTGCVPAHALYFSSYELIKRNLSVSTVDPKTGTSSTNLDAFGATVAGVISTFFHDSIMTPMDTVKQRMQLGHYESMTQAFSLILQQEGALGLYRSFGVTLLTNLPYGIIVMNTNEFLRNAIMSYRTMNGAPNILDFQTTMLSGCGAGMVAAACTSPLDRVKTRLQTQHFGNSAPVIDGIKTCPNVKANIQVQLKYKGLVDALNSIVKEEGASGLFRGLIPRLMTHTPAVAISWSAYEMAKKWLHNTFDK